MGHIFKVLDNSNYINEKEKCLLLVEKMFENDNNKLANIADFKKHLDFIFSATYGNKAFLILFIIDEKLENMVNFYEYNSLEHDWCIFNLFTEKENLIAQKLFEKVGFIREGLIREDIISRGKYVDRYIYGICKKDFLSEEY